MDQYIIGFGQCSDAAVRVIEASSFRAAYAEAVRRTRAHGWAKEDWEDLEETFAEPWTEDRAYDLGLLAGDGE